MPAMLISKEEWNTIKLASEAGVDDQQLSEDYGVSKASIRKRRQLDKWLTPRKIEEEKAVAKAKALARQSPSNISQVSQKPSAEESIASKLLKMGETGTLALAEVALQKALFVRDNPETIDDLETIGDMSTALKLLRTAAGMDKQESNVAVALNFGAFWESPGSTEVERPRVLDV